MKKVVLKLMLYVAPFAAVFIVAAYTPLTTFTFRHWEGHSVYNRSQFPGPFYPLQKSVMMEEGDMGHGTPYALLKKVRWETDRYGYRKADSREHPEIVVIGDSMIAGSSLSQEEIFSEVLHKKVGRPVYPYAIEDLNNFLQDARFAGNPPRIVILERVERDILNHDKLKAGRAANPTAKASLKSHVKTRIKSLANSDNRFIRQTVIAIDRIRKQELLHYIRARIEPKTMGVRYQGMFFCQGTTAAVTARESEIRKTVKIIKEYDDYFRKRQILFIYMPVPNKETIFSELLPTRPRFTILREVLDGLKQAGVPTIDLLGAYESEKNSGGIPFQIDDTHWNARGVEIAAGLAAEKISRSE